MSDTSRACAFGGAICNREAETAILWGTVYLPSCYRCRSIGELIRLDLKPILRELAGLAKEFKRTAVWN